MLGVLLIWHRYLQMIVVANRVPTRKHPALIAMGLINNMLFQHIVKYYNPKALTQILAYKMFRVSNTVHGRLHMTVKPNNLNKISHLSILFKLVITSTIILSEVSQLKNYKNPTGSLTCWIRGEY